MKSKLTVTKYVVVTGFARDKRFANPENEWVPALRAAELHENANVAALIAKTVGPAARVELVTITYTEERS